MVYSAPSTVHPWDKEEKMEKLVPYDKLSKKKKKEHGHGAMTPRPCFFVFEELSVHRFYEQAA